MKPLYLLLTVLLFIPISFAGSYNHTGYDDFVLERGTFNANTDPLEDISTTSRSLIDGRYVPLVADMDNDGTNEILVIDDNDVKLFQDTSLTPLGSAVLSGTGGLSNQIIFDIDGDGYREMIVAEEEDELMRIYQYNGSVFSLDNSFTLSGITAHTVSGANSGQFLLQCRDVNDCLLVWGRQGNGITGTSIGMIYAQSFNSTDMIGSALALETTASAVSQTACFPKIRTMEASDLTGDGDKEYIFSYMFYIGGGLDTDKYRVKALDVSSGTVSTAWTFSIDADSVTDPSGTIACSDNVERFFSPATVFDFDSSTSGRESMIAYMINSNAYRIKSIDATGGEIDQFPEIDSGAGILISNAFKSNVFPSGNRNDICAVGYDNGNNEITMICGSKDASELFETYEYTASVTSISPAYNVTQDYLNHNVISHSTQQSNALSDGVDLSEILTPYGVYTADFEECSILGNCDDGFNNIFLNFCGDSVNLAIDIENIGSTDLLCMTDTEIVYIDDLLSNQPATITQLSFDPCITDTIIKVNETLKVTVQVTDGVQGSIPADKVNQIVTTYKDTDNELISSAFNLTSGSQNSHFMLLNQTGTNFNLEVQGYDNGKPSSIDIIDLTFSVGQNGAETGTGQTCTLSFAEEEEETAINETLLITDSQNSGTAVVSLIQQLTGFGGVLAWILIMLIVGIGLYVSPTVAGINMSGHMTSMIAFIFFIEMVLLIAGVLLGFIGIGFLITMFVILITAIGIAISRYLQGARTP